MLSLGFAAGHVMIARARDIPVALAGVDAWPVPFPESNKFRLLQLWYGLFTRVIVRTRRSADDVRVYGHEVVHGGDWALRLQLDSAPDVTDDPRRALVVLREDAPENLGEGFAAWTDALLADIAGAGYRPVILPFSPEDERFADELGLAERFEVERAWWNARRLKQVIGASGLLVTAGRLHPMIFGAPTGCAIASVRMPHWSGPRAGSMVKLNDMAQELGIASFDTREAFAAALHAGEISCADEEKLATSMGRVERTIAMLHRLFKPKVKQPAGGLLLPEAV
jgi:polysaccharide pyruvyl transferase WcaK-like protein